MNNNTNNFWGEVTNMQIQQGAVSSTQIQTVSSNETIDFDNLAEFIAKIKKYDAFLEDEYGDKATEVRELLTKIDSLVQKRKSPSKIKMLLVELKNLSVGIVGSLIATGVVDGIKAFM